MKAMFSLKNVLMLLAASLLSVSCTLPEPYQASSPVQSPRGGASSGTPKTASQLKEDEELKRKRVKANKEAAARRAKLRNRKSSSSNKPRKSKKSSSSSSKKKSGSSSSSSNSNSGEITPGKREPVKPSKSFPTAKKIPGKDGLVFNPWTNKTVDVRGIASGTLIRDPNDGNPTHKFRVP